MSIVCNAMAGQRSVRGVVRVGHDAPHFRQCQCGIIFPFVSR